MASIPHASTTKIDRPTDCGVDGGSVGVAEEDDDGKVGRSVMYYFY